MILNKKFLSKDFVGRLCVCAARFDITNFNINNDLICLSKLMSYILETNIDISKILIDVYESDSHHFLFVLGNIINNKIINPNISPVELKQKLINIIENKVDNMTFSDLNSFINSIFTNINSHNISNIIYDKEFDRILKFVNINLSLNKLNTLYESFYEKEDSMGFYEESITDLFKKYKNTIVSKDFTITKEGDMDSIVDSVNNMSQDVRTISILDKIRFCEKKRVAIAVGITNSGKSMFLCHCAGEYVTTPKDNDNKNLVFYFTFENSREETLIRIMANVLEIEIDTIKELIKDPETRSGLIKEYVSKVDKNTILRIIELPPKKHSMTTIRAEMEKELLSYNNVETYAVLLDYVDKMIPIDRSNKTKRYDQQLGDVVDDFKALVNEFECAGISVSQVNREGAKMKHNGGNVNMTHMGGSWEKVENADIVIMMDVDENLYDDLGYISVIFKNEKHRYVKEGSLIPLFFKPQFSRFYPNTDAMEMMQQNKKMSNEMKHQDATIQSTTDCFA